VCLCVGVVLCCCAAPRELRMGHSTSALVAGQGSVALHARHALVCVRTSHYAIRMHAGLKQRGKRLNPGGVCLRTDTMPLRCVAVCVKVCSSVCDVIHCMLRALHGWAQGTKQGNTTNRACKRCSLHRPVSSPTCFRVGSRAKHRGLGSQHDTTHCL
jgi:hypothetical protein